MLLVSRIASLLGRPFPLVRADGEALAEVMAGMAEKTLYRPTFQYLVARIEHPRCRDDFATSRSRSQEPCVQH